jgi:hypothetical protein
MSKNFLLNNSKFKLYSPNPKLFDYFEKKKTVLNLFSESSNNKGFNKTFNTKIDDEFDGWITDMVLRIELPKLIDTDPGDGGYLNWVDNIGHALIEYIDLQVFGHTIINKDTPYGLWLDIYNELNDINNNEWDIIGKNASIDSLKIYKTTTKILYIPLHFWFSKDNESAFPHFIVNKNAHRSRTCLKFKVKISDISNLIITSGSTNVDTYKDKSIKKIDLIFDSIRSKNLSDDAELQKTIDLLYKSYGIKNHYKVYFDNYKFDTVSTKTGSSLTYTHKLEDALKFIYFVIRHDDRIKTSNITDKVPLNDAPNKTNANDIFNYSNKDAIVNLNTYDTFETLQLTLQGGNKNWITTDGVLDSIYFRKVVPYLNKKHVPQKHIYTIDFSNSINNDINGYLHVPNQGRDLIFKFTNQMKNSQITIISVVLNYIKIKVDKDNILRVGNSNWKIKS